MKWIGKGVLKIGQKEYLNYGEDMPKDFSKKRLEELKEMGLVGEIIQPISENFQAENELLKKEIEELKKQLEKYEKKSKNKKDDGGE